MTWLGAVGRRPGPAWDPMGHAVGARGPAWRQPFFVDASGNPRSRSGDDAYYTLGCVTGSPEALGNLSRLMYGLKLGLVPGRDPRSWELHGVRITHRRRGYPLKPRTEAARLAVFGAATRAICESGVTLLVIAVDNRRAHAEFGPGANISGRAWTLFLERCEMCMRYQGADAMGHVISDRVGSVDMRQTHALVFDSTRRRNPISGVRTSRIDGIEFVDSLDSPMVQAADIMAYIISRDINGDGRFGGMAGSLRERTWASTDGAWLGWKEI